MTTRINRERVWEQVVWNISRDMWDKIHEPVAESTEIGFGLGSMRVTLGLYPVLYSLKVGSYAISELTRARVEAITHNYRRPK